MVLNNAAEGDLGRTAGLMSGGSPKMIYTSFLLGLVREYFSLIMTENVDEERVERGFSTLIGFCPDSSARERIWRLYIARRDNQDRVTAATITIGDLVDYLSEALDLTETSEGGFL